jgi:uncharacterized cupin superfamily protein
MHTDNKPMPADLQAFRAQALAEGYEEPLLRQWAAQTVLTTHTHPFDAFAVLVQGEMVLSAEGQSRTLRPGDRFMLAREVPHEERYGHEGASYWVARRHPASGH